MHENEINNLVKTISMSQKEIDGLVSYIQLKILQKDWHAVMDAAADIRELEAKILFARELLD